MVASAFEFKQYQRRVIESQARFMILLWARQLGKGFTIAYKVVNDVMAHEASGRATTWIIMAASLRQAKETARKIRKFLRAYEMATKALGVSYFEDVKLNSFEFEFPNGSRIITVPGNPDTVAGLTGNLICDEFALFKDNRELYSIIFPIVSSSDDLKFYITSTPRGKDLYYELCTAPDSIFEIHKVTIEDAVRMGMKRDIALLRKGMGSDEDGWRREFMCEFLDEAEAFLTFDLISSCEDALAGNPERAIVGGPIYVGVDIGRKHDLTVIWELEISGDVGWTRRVTRLKNVPYRAQEAFLQQVMRHQRVVRCSIDETGIGAMLAENLSLDFRGRVDKVTFSLATKEALATALKAEFEDRRLRIPIDSDTRTSLHSVKRIATTGGNFRYDAERNEAGHADEFWALALARDAWKGSNVLHLTGLPLNTYGRDMRRAVGVA
jgi:phage FluMu gp28-like protein